MTSQILVVDDEPGALHLLGLMLKRRGFQILQATDGYQALGTLDHNTPDVIILDIMMPQMNGIELCSRIRQLPRFETTPIIMLTALGDSASINQAADAGASDFLQKPILRHDLIAAIEKHLEYRPT